MTALQRTVFVPRPRTAGERRSAVVDRIRRAGTRPLPEGRPPMSRGVVLAAVDGSDTTWPVLATAQVLGGILGAPVQAVYARPAGTRTPARLSAIDLPLRVVEGNVVSSLVDAGQANGVAAVVLGARAHMYDERALGRTASWLVTSLDTPVVVVPPETDPCARIRRVLVPLEGTEATSVASQPLGQPALEAGLDVQALHIMTPETVPAFIERTRYGDPSWSRDFLTRYCSWGCHAVKLTTRIGRPEELIPEAVWECASDLVVLGWSQRLSPGRARVVQSVLWESAVPVALAPVPRAPVEAGSVAGTAWSTG